MSVESLDKYREFSKEKGWVNPYGETTWSIGQCLQFLDEFVGDEGNYHDPVQEEFHRIICSDDLGLTFRVVWNKEKHPELIDALFEEIKTLL